MVRCRRLILVLLVYIYIVASLAPVTCEPPRCIIYSECDYLSAAPDGILLRANSHAD